MSAIARLEEWLTYPRTRKPVTELGEDELDAVRKALAEGKNGYSHRAVDLLEALAIRNGRNEGETTSHLGGLLPELTSTTRLKRCWTACRSGWRWWSRIR
jgi:hypothetical protein